MSNLIICLCNFMQQRKLKRGSDSMGKTTSLFILHYFGQKILSVCSLIKFKTKQYNIIIFININYSQWSLVSVRSHLINKPLFRTRSGQVAARSFVPGSCPSIVASTCSDLSISSLSTLFNRFLCGLIVHVLSKYS